MSGLGVRSLRRALLAARIFWQRAPTALRVGLSGSALWIALVGAYACNRWQKVIALDPNNLGDFLAGAFAPLAFLWLAVAVFLQKDELSLQRQELMHSRKVLQEQAIELRRSVRQQERQAELAEKAARRSWELELAESLDVAIDNLASSMAVANEGAWVYISQPQDDDDTLFIAGEKCLFGENNSIQRLIDAKEFDRALITMREAIDNLYRAIERTDERVVISRSFLPAAEYILDELQRVLRRSKGIVQAELSERLRNLRPTLLRDGLARLIVLVRQKGIEDDR